MIQMRATSVKRAAVTIQKKTLIAMATVQRKQIVQVTAVVLQSLMTAEFAMEATTV